MFSPPPAAESFKINRRRISFDGKICYTGRRRYHHYSEGDFQMEYQVSEKVRDSFQKLTENEKVQKALAFMGAD